MSDIVVKGIAVTLLLIISSFSGLGIEASSTLGEEQVVFQATNNTQNDGGSGGDAGNTSGTSVSLSQNNGSYIGWVDDTTDPEDLFEVYIPSGDILTVEMSFPNTEDFDLYLVDSAVTFAYDVSEFSNPEIVSTGGTNLSAGGTSVYIYVVAYTGYGQYSLNITFSTPVSQNDAGSGGDASSQQATALTLTSSSATYNGYIDSVTDTADLYNMTIPSGDELWVNLTYPSGGNFSLVMIDSGWTYYIDDDYDVTTGSSSVTTNGTNISGGGVMVYFGIIANSGSGNYTMQVTLANPNQLPSPAVSVSMNGKDSSDNHFTGLTIGVNYSITYTVYEYPLNQTGSNYSSSFYWVANSSSMWDNVTFQSDDIEGIYGIFVFIEVNGSFVAYDMEMLYYEMLEANMSSGSSASYQASNLTSGQSYSMFWYYNDNVTNTTVDYGWNNFTASGTSYSNTLSMTGPSTTNEYVLTTLLMDSNSTFIGLHTASYLPPIPSILITGVTTDVNATTNSVDVSMSSLSSGASYSYQTTVSLFNNGTISMTSNLTNFTATSSTHTGQTFHYNTPSQSGLYCAETILYLSGSQIDSDTYCFNLTYDNDNDGVANEHDLCPNTATGASVDMDGCSASQRDSDGDGFMDDVDAFPNDPSQWYDSDGDGYGDNPNGTNADVFPNDPTQWSDLDGDGFGDNQTGVNPDEFPFDSTQWKDTDGDGYGDNSNGTQGDMYPLDPSQWYDSDGDGYGDNSWGNNGDAFPADSTQWSDADGDGYGDNTSGNDPDAFPNDGTQWSDQDGDGWGDNQQGDDPDIFPTDPTQWADSDGDGYGDNQQGTNPDAFPLDSTQWADRDGDGYGDNPSGTDADIFPDDPTQWADSDNDGYGDDANGNSGDLCPNTPPGEVVDENGCSASQEDSDGDGVMDDDDLCPATTPGQSVNSQGCAENQIDDDMDGVNNSWDTCPNTPPGMVADNQGCSAGQRDTDGDGIDDSRDLCPTTTPGDDVDGTGCADVEKDSDEDGINDSLDACPNTLEDDSVDASGCSAAQRDSDGDGVMDDVDDCALTDSNTQVDENGCGGYQVDSDGDGVNDEIDACPGTDTGVFVSTFGCAESQLDSDGDGRDDASDLCPGSLLGSPTDIYGCSPDQRDGDSDGVKDHLDICPSSAEGSFVDSDGCALDQKDSDSDGVADELDAFPNDPDATKDTDEDGVPDGEDYFPNDPTMWRAEDAKDLTWLIWVLTFVIGACGVAMFFMRSKSKTAVDHLEDDNIALFQEAMPAESLHEMAAAETKAEQWVDEAGVHWARQADGSVMFYDAVSGDWKLQ